MELRGWGGGVVRKHVDGGILFPKLIRMLERSYAGMCKKIMTLLMGASVDVWLVSGGGAGWGMWLSGSNPTNPC